MLRQLIAEPSLLRIRVIALGIRKRREQKFSQEGVRRHAIRVLAAVAALTREQRERVLRHALKLNKV